MRAVWVVRHEMTTPERVRGLVARATEAGLNTLFVQVRGRGDAYYASSLVPEGEGVEEDFDPLQLCIELASKAGLRVHAWVNVYLTWYPDRPPPLSHILRSNPDWFMISQDGIDLGQQKLHTDLVKRGVEGRYLSPANPAVSRHLLRVIDELVSGYAVDGIHLDYVRYPKEHYDFSPIAQSVYWSDTDKEAPATGSSTDDRKVWNRWRSEQVTRFVRSTKELVRKRRKTVEVSAAVKPDHVLAYQRYGQNWVHWVNRRYLDFVIPMFYTGTTEKVKEQMRTVRKYVQKGRVYAGIGAWNQTTANTLDQIDAAFATRLSGFSLFSYDTVVTSSDLRTALRERYASGGQP